MIDASSEIHPAALHINPRFVTRTLWAAAALLILTHLSVKILMLLGVEARGYIFDLWPKIDLNEEANVPTYFSSFLLLCASALLAAVGWTGRGEAARWSRHWKGLAAIFLFLSMDETAGLHEFAGLIVKASLKLGGIFYFGWPALAVAVLPPLAVMYFKFVRALPRRALLSFMAAGFVYVGGALGVELVEGWYVDAHGIHTLAFSALAALEEGMEMCGMVMFIGALLDYLSAQAGEILLRVGADADPSAPGVVKSHIYEDKIAARRVA